MYHDRLGLRASVLLAVGVGAPGCFDEDQLGKTPSVSVETTLPDTTAWPERSCEAPERMLDGEGRWGGLSQCSDGSIVREQEAICDATFTGPVCGFDDYGSCAVDADCTERSNGHCRSGNFGCFCTYTCSTDAECEADEVCLCGGVLRDVEWSQCVRATCASGEDCASGLCGVANFQQGSGCDWNTVVDCFTDFDTCRTNSECPQATPNDPFGIDTYCAEDEGRWSCQEPWGGICGRPLLVEGAARLAPTVRRSDWQAAATPAPPPSRGVREHLAAHWRRVGAMEHASVASFARVSMQLMALGAPPELLVETHRAAADEVEHARIAFGLAEACGAREAGPGPLSLEGVALRVDRREVLEGLIVEACVGETVAAAELAEAAHRATDPEVRRALARIAADEQRHAALGWRTLRWMLEGADAEAMRWVKARFDEAMAEVGAETPAGPHLPEHGVLGGDVLIELRQETIVAVVRPAVRALVAGGNETAQSIRA